MHQLGSWVDLMVAVWIHKKITIINKNMMKLLWKYFEGMDSFTYIQIKWINCIFRNSLYKKKLTSYIQWLFIIHFTNIFICWINDNFSSHLWLEYHYTCGILSMTRNKKVEICEFVIRFFLVNHGLLYFEFNRLFYHT